jgi:hypothetical protein
LKIVDLAQIPESKNSEIAYSVLFEELVNLTLSIFDDKGNWRLHE